MATQWTAGTTSGQVLTAATLNTIGAAWETWTPALTASTTNPTLGTGSSQTGQYGRINKIVIGNGAISFGTAGVAAGSGLYFFSIPVTAQAAGPVCGSWFGYDSSTGAIRVGTLGLDSTTRMVLQYEGSYMSNGAPWTWAASDLIRVAFYYQAA